MKWRCTVVPDGDAHLVALERSGESVVVLRTTAEFAELADAVSDLIGAANLGAQLVDHAVALGRVCREVDDQAPDEERASLFVLDLLAWDPAQRRYKIAPAVRGHGTGDAR